MAYLQPAGLCVCGSCPGKWPAPQGHYGGSICGCTCHNRDSTDAVPTLFAACGWCGNTDRTMVRLLGGNGPHCCTQCLDSKQVTQWLEMQEAK